MALLPPKLVGPITPVAPSVRVEHVLPGAWVEIHVNGSPTGQVALATSNAVDVPISSPFSPGSAVTATWSHGGETSAQSLRQIVLGYPSALGAPVIYSPIHTAMDWVDVGVLYPGATVTIRDGNGVVIGGPSTAASASARISLNATVSGGERIYAQQSVDPPGTGVVNSPMSESLPAEEWYAREESPPVPVVIGPIRECDGAVLVGGAVHGCTIRLRVGGRDIDYDAVGPSFWAVLPDEAKQTDTFAAANVLRQLGRVSGFSATVGVNTAAPLDTPRLDPDTQYCPLAVSVTASSLAPRAVLTFDLRAASGSTNLFRAGAPDDRRTDTYYLGDLSASIPFAPPYPAVVLVEQLCALSAESNRAGVHRRAGQQKVPPGFFFTPQECATAVHVVNAGGCVVSIHSDAADWPVLASFAIVPPSGWVGVNRPLRGGEDIWVTVEAGCIPPNLTTSDGVTVESADLDKMRIVEPIRPGAMCSVFLQDPVRGGRVHVYVNGIWRASGTALPTPGQAWTEVPVGVLREEDSVTACQTLCGRTSDVTPAAMVVRGRIRLRGTVTSLVRGVATAITVSAFDADTGAPLGGLRVKGPAGDVAWVGQSFIITASGPAATLRLTVDAEGYDQGVLDLAVTSPAPPPPKTLTVRSQVALGAHVVGQKITKIAWTLSGPNAPAPQSQSPGVTNCQFVFAIPAPAGAVAWYQLSGSATIGFVDPASGSTQTRTVSSFYTAFGLRGWIDVEWRGVPRWREINIAWAPIHDPSTGEVIDTVFCFVLAADG